MKALPSGRPGRQVGPTAVLVAVLVLAAVWQARRRPRPWQRPSRPTHHRRRRTGWRRGHRERGVHRGLADPAEQHDARDGERAGRSGTAVPPHQPGRGGGGLRGPRLVRVQCRHRRQAGQRGAAGGCSAGLAAGVLRTRVVLARPADPARTGLVTRDGPRAQQAGGVAGVRGPDPGRRAPRKHRWEAGVRAAGRPLPPHDPVGDRACARSRRSGRLEGPGRSDPHVGEPHRQGRHNDRRARRAHGPDARAGRSKPTS